MASLLARLKRGTELVAAALFAAMFGAFLVQVVSRYVFGNPVSWTIEICSITYIWIVFLASSTILTPRQHITFDMLYGSVGPYWKRRLAIISTASTLVIFSICLPTTIGYVLFSSHYHTLILHIRMDIIYSCFAIFMVGTIAGAAVRLRRLLSQDWTKQI